MLLQRWQTCILLLIFIFFVNSGASGAFVGVNIRTDVFNLQSAEGIVSVLQAQQIKHVRLFDADHQMLNALANTGIEVMIGIPNDQLPVIGNSQEAAADWINKNIADFLPATDITCIAVGNEVLTTTPDAALLLPAMQFLHSALLAADLHYQVKVSSPHSMLMIPKSFPPSTATFNLKWNSLMHQFLLFLKNTDSSFLFNAHPYYGHTKGEDIFTIDNSLFQSFPSNKQIMEPKTPLNYSNTFDAMVVAAYYAMQALDVYGIPVIVTEFRGPRLDGPKEPDTMVDNALVYNSNLIRHVLDDSGTPSQPNTAVGAYLYELFNEGLQPGLVSEKNWEDMSSNRNTLYSLRFASLADAGTNLQGLVFCVANSSADTDALTLGLNWACGPGSANCSAIQPGQPCYEANDLAAVASYAYNDYYQRMKANGGTCDFNNTAMLTTSDPSHGLCIFTGSIAPNPSPSNSTTVSPGSAGSGGSIAPLSPFDGVAKLQVLKITYLIPVILYLWFDM
ncbi:glucan endo-1,3-beta-glucosidase 4-like isoform X2 [Phoenix dactylifera]|uniref:Glucan endo-1,3-beta-glucosidase 4-like isoform X2 n=1 Tax=Phoenix dactylifera TaxID=42345 RepID=A0A8B7BI47_PHODC|nr:glucan endo-1,3-beta-glucosidase 4-like isoform X2 [Phoenix dactylifera]